MRVLNPRLETFKHLRHHPGLKIVHNGRITFLPLEVSGHWSTYSNEELLAIAEKQCQDALADMDIYVQSVLGFILSEPLQLLGDLIAWEVHKAVQWFHDAKHLYQPITGLGPMDKDKVTRVMAAMQQEIHREAERTKMAEYMLSEMPYSRQRALATRRRYILHAWGIDQEAWERNSFSLWKVPERWEVSDDYN